MERFKSGNSLFDGWLINYKNRTFRPILIEEEELKLITHSGGIEGMKRPVRIIDHVSAKQFISADDLWILLYKN